MAFQDLIDFSGGINTSISPMKIDANEAVVATSCDISTGAIVATVNPFTTTTPASQNAVYYSDKDMIVSSAEDRHYVEFAGYLYWTNKAGLMQRYNGTTTNNIGGWTKPTTAPALVANTTYTAMAGSYTYCFTYMHDGAFESPPSLFTQINSISSTGVNLTFSGTPPASATSRVIYRMGGVVPTFRFIAEVPIATLTYSDNIADLNIDPYELVSFDNEPPVSGLDMLIENSGTFFASKGDKVYFSRQGTPEYWNEYNYVDLPSNVTGLGKVGSSIVAFTASEMFMISGYDLNTISVSKLPFQYGCSNKRTVCNIENDLIWTANIAGRVIVCSFNGQTVSIISDKHRQFDQFGYILDSTYDSFTTENYNNFTLVINRAVVFNSECYLMTNIGTYIFDFNTGFRISLFEYVADSMIVKNTSLIAVKNGYLCDINTSFLGHKNLIYKTGELTNGSAIARKTYRRVRVRGKGNFTTTVIIDRVSVFTSSELSFYIQAESVGTSIQFMFKSDGYAEISGVSYEYEVLAL